MSETMTVYFVTRTWHVLGAVTRVAVAGKQPPQKAASQEDVLVRAISAQSAATTLPRFLVPKAELSTLALAPLPTLLVGALKFHVPDPGTEAQLLPGPTVASVTLSSEDLTVTVSADVTAEEPVWALITGGPLTGSRLATGIIPVNKNSTTLTLETLPPGEYHILALVRRHRPFADIQTISPNPVEPPQEP